MFHCNQTTRTVHARAVLVLFAGLLASGAMAANVTLQTIAVTPAAKLISVGEKQAFTATGTFSNGSKQALGPAMSKIAAGTWSTCALLISGGVECWGRNNTGQLGIGRLGNALVPGSVKELSGAKDVALGYEHACALLTSGAVRCWGYAYRGALGNGSKGGVSTTPVSVTSVSTATALGAGDQGSCALLAGGAIQCWGFNGQGQLGNGTGGTGGINEFSTTPVSVIGISTATALAVGDDHSCALLTSGAIQCWGFNGNGQLGNGIVGGAYNTPVTVTGIVNATAVSTGGDITGGEFSCALFASGAVQCWGANYYGQLGNGSSITESSTPVPVTGISTAIAIALGASHACAVLRNGSVQCWGNNASGQLGNGNTTNSNVPVTVRGIYAPTRLTAGWRHTCALFAGGVMRCWGQDDFGQLGNRKTTNSSFPVTVLGTPGVVWSSTDPSKATITDRGVAMGRAVGNTTITATTAGFINDNAVLTVK